MRAAFVLLSEVATRMKKRKRRTGLSRPGYAVALKPCEVRVSFWVRSPDGRDHTFSVAAGLLNNQMDLDVSFTGAGDEVQHISAWLIARVQQAIELVKAQVRPEDLVERDG